MPKQPTPHDASAIPKEEGLLLPDEGKQLLASVQWCETRECQDVLRKAIDFAVRYHGSQKRQSGDPYYSHPIAVAQILADMGMDYRTVVTGLLHDTVEDTEATLEQLEELFGEDVRQLVDGVTKLTKIEFKSADHKQAENFRKFMLAISQDLRVLLVKLADRLHNMRTLYHIAKPEKRQRIAHETLEIYATLAERIGMQKIKSELQDIAFKELNYDGYNSIVARLQYLHESNPEMIERTVLFLENLLQEAGIKAEVSGRLKMPYSIWCKMQRRNVDFEHLSDIVAFRIVVDAIPQCYSALGVVHEKFHMIPENFKDYISTAKNNGYQSIHSVVMGPEQRPLEVQIRTQDMHDVAENGVAAHWAYKQDQHYDGRQYRWVRELLHILEQINDPEELLEHTRMEMYHDQVFCFTPRGDLIALPRGATPVDFAFAVHSEVGRRCVGTKINGRIMPLRSQLNNGDQVEVLLSKSQQPSPSWEHFVVTGKARSEIRRFIRMQQQDEFVSLGKGMLSNALARHNKKLTKDDIATLLPTLNYDTIDDLYAALGNGLLARDTILAVLAGKSQLPDENSESIISRVLHLGKQPHAPQHKHDEKTSMPIDGLIPGMAIHFAGCCHPLPGERIVGIVNSGKGVTIHTSDCKELERYVDQPERWLDVTWKHGKHEGAFIGRLQVMIAHRKGALATLANTIAQGEGNILNVRMASRTADVFEMIVDLEVEDIGHLGSITALLRSKQIIHSVERYQEGR